jgi:hypothetical protein
LKKYQNLGSGNFQRKLVFNPEKYVVFLFD